MNSVGKSSKVSFVYPNTTSISLVASYGNSINLIRKVRAFIFSFHLVNLHNALFIVLDKEIPMTFTELLTFITGADHVPPCGFPSRIEIQFYTREDGENRLPYVSTCALQFRLPRGVGPEVLSELLVRAVKETSGFLKV